MDGYHGCYQNILLTSATYSFSVFCRAGDKSWLYLRCPQVEPILLDGSMEAAGTTNWVVSPITATLSKETVSPHEGLQNLKVLNSSGAPDNTWSFQVIMAVGKSYSATGWARSDGTGIPRVQLGSGGSAWSGTTSTSWQEVNITGIATTGVLYLGSITLGNGNYVEFDDIVITEVDPIGCYFDIANGVVGTADTGVTGYIEDWGNDWYRCCMVHIASAKFFTHYIQSANADGDNTFAGDGSTVNTYLWGAQVEATDYMTSLIPSTTAAVTRNADILYFKADDGNLGGIGSELQGTIVFNQLLQDYNATIIKYFMTLSDGGSAAEVIGLTNAVAADTSAAYIYTLGAAQANIIGSINIYDNVIHKLRMTWVTNDVKNYVDGLENGTPDTSAAIPDDLDRLNIGSSQAGVIQPGGLISGIKIYKKVTRK